MERLEAKNIAFDSQFIISQNFLDGNLINEFARQADKGLIKLFLTQITYREVLKHFKEKLYEAKSKNADNLARKLYVLKHFESYQAYFNLPQIDIDQCIIEFEKQFDHWIHDHKVTILHPNMLQVESVLEDYFEMRPPFENSKKSEFPDAFTLAILKKHFEFRKRKCYLITGDVGLKKYQSDVILTTLNAKEILELVITEFDTESPIALIETQFREQENKINDLIVLKLKSHVKNTILNANIIGGRLINGLESLDVFINENVDIYVLSIDQTKFSMIMSSIVIIISEISLLSSSISGSSDDNNKTMINEKSTVEIKEMKLVDVTIKGTFFLNKGIVNFTDFSFSPIDDLMDRIHS